MQRPGQCTSKATVTSVKITEIPHVHPVQTWKIHDFADHLSHNVHSGSSREPTIPNLDLEVSSMELNASLSKLELIRQESECDLQILILKKLIIQGWPKDIKQCPAPVRSYWQFQR